MVCGTGDTGRCGALLVSVKGGPLGNGELRASEKGRLDVFPPALPAWEEDWEILSSTEVQALVRKS